MKHYMYKVILVVMLSFCAATLLDSCKKNSDTAASLPADQKLLDRNLLVSYAKDDGTDITINYNGIIFKFTGPATALSGGATASNTLLTVNGTWSLNTSRNKITFAFPTNAIPELSHMNKQWLIANPSANPVVLTALLGENDELRFSIM